MHTEAESKEKHAGANYNLTLCSLQSRLRHIYHGLGNHMPESTLTLCSRVDFVPQVRDFGFDLCTLCNKTGPCDRYHHLYDDQNIYRQTS